jgi:putative lipoic acid-binding regulatory protein
MSALPNPDEFYKNLEKQLYDTATWPSEYLYKFIVISDQEKIEAIEASFNYLGAIIETKASKGRKYTSISINVLMENPEAVIDKYKEVSEKVKDVISL